MAEIDDLRDRIAYAADVGDTQQLERLSTEYRDLQAQRGELPVLGRGFNARSGREYQLAQRALQLREAGREDDATNLMRIIARERVGAELSDDKSTVGRNRALVLGLNHVLLNAGTYARAGAEELVDKARGDEDPRGFRDRVEDINAVSEQVRRANPLSSGAGEVLGVVATLPAAAAGAAKASQAVRAIPGVEGVAARIAPVARASEIGAEARAAQLAARGGRVGQVSRGAARAAIPGATYGATYGASDAFARGEDAGGVAEGAAEGATFGAGGGVVLRGGGEVVKNFAGPIFERLSNSSAVKQIARRLQEPVNDVVERMLRFQQQYGRMPSAAEILNQRSGREVASAISGHGDAVETAIRLSGETAAARPAQFAEAVTAARPRAREAAADITRNASDRFSQVMRDVGDHAVTLDDDALSLLTTRTAQSVLRQPDGILTQAGQRVADAVEARVALANARTAAVEANNEARRLSQRVAEAARSAADLPPEQARAAQQGLASLRRQAERAVGVAEDARGRVVAAAERVRPVSLSIREIETLRHDIGNKAREGNTYALNELSDQVRGLASRAGRPGMQYELGLRQFAAEQARAEGVTVGRRAARNATDEARAAARGAEARGTGVRPTRAGAREGTVSGFAERGGADERGLRETAADLAENTNTGALLRETQTPREAARLQELGRVAGEAAENLQSSTPGPQMTVAEQVSDLVRSWTNAAVVASGHTGGAFKANVAHQILSKLSVSPQAARELAEMAFDPNRSGEFVTQLARYSGSAERTRRNLEFISGFLPAQAARAYADAQTADQSEAAGEDPAVQLNDLRRQIEAAADRGDEETVRRLAPRYRELQGQQ